MTDISLTAPSAYDPQMLAIARQQKLAEMLSQMGAQEIPVSSAGGISAPISPMSALVKGLSSFGGSYLAGQAENKANDYENSKLSDALKARMAGFNIDPNTISSATSTTPEQPGFFDRAANFLGIGGNQEKPAIAGPAAPANTPTAPIDAEGTPTGTYMLPPTPASAPQPKNDAEGTPTSSYMPSQQPASPNSTPVLPSQQPASPNSTPVLPSQQPTSPNAAPVLPYLAKLDQQARYYTAYTPTTLQGKIDQQTGLINIQQIRKDYLNNLPRYQALLAAAPPEIRSQLQAAIDTNNTALLDKYEGTQLDKSTPQVTVDETLRNALDAGPKGSPAYNTYLAWKLGGVEPPEAFKQDLAKAAAQRSIITNSQSGANIPDNDPAVLGYVNAIHSGLGSLRSVPMNMRGAVARVLAAETDPSGSPTITALQTSAAKKITDPYTSNPRYTLYANAQPFLDRLKAAASMNSSVGDPDLLDSLTKLETGGNAITEGMVSTNLLGQSIKDKINVIKNKYTAQGGVLSEDQRKQVVQLGQTIYDNYKAGYKDVYTAATKQLNAAKIPSQYWTIPDLNQFESGGNQSNIAPAGMSATLQDGTVVHSDGKGNWK